MNIYLQERSVNPYILYNTLQFTENFPLPSTVTFIPTKILQEWQLLQASPKWPRSLGGLAGAALQSSALVAIHVDHDPKQ